MAFCFGGVLLVILAMVFQPLKGRSIQPPWRTDKTQDTEETKRDASSTFKFLNHSEIAKGLDYLKKKYPDVDWSAVTPTSTTGKRELENDKFWRQAKRTSSFKFFNQSEIAKGLDYLKKKYPDVDWSAVTPTSTTGKRELENDKFWRQAKRTSSFKFLNQSEIAKGLDYLKKKYPDVDWSAVTPTSGTGKREFVDLKTNDIINEMTDEEKRSVETPDSFTQQRNDIPEERYNSEGLFLEPQDHREELEYSYEKFPEIDWSAVIEKALHAEY